MTQPEGQPTRECTSCVLSCRLRRPECADFRARVLCRYRDGQVQPPAGTSMSDWKRIREEARRA